MVKNQRSKITLANNKTLNLYDDIEQNCKKEIIIEDNSTLNYVKYSNTDVEFTLETTVGENSTLNIFIYQNTSGINEIINSFKDCKGSINIYILNVLKDNSKVKNIIRTLHECESYSDIKLVNLLDNEASLTIDMLTKVEKNAEHSKAFQNSKTILLSDDAQIKVTPHLEISIDELEASHGASVGELDINSLFYLRSRGIDEQRAKEILLQALKIDLIDNLSEQKVKEFIGELL